MSDLPSILKPDTFPIAPQRTETGRRGEVLAAEYLQSQGYRLVLSNFKVPIGRNRRGAAVTGEIDLIALDGDVLCFVEVKTRQSADFADPIASVTTRKQRQITRTARLYRRIFRLSEMQYRFDVVAIVLAPGVDPLIELTKDFWSEAKFRKKSWSGDIH
jgi:putative endonuclease